MGKPKITKTIFKVLTGVIIGSAVGSILGVTLAPRKGSETREMLREKTRDIWGKNTDLPPEKEKSGILKRMLAGFLGRKK